jgi:uncharacterized short protein YbdD (DUF466 family)
MTHIQKLLWNLWELLRDACGENDYVRYRTYALGRAQQPMTPGDFYREKLQRKYSRPNRCC